MKWRIDYSRDAEKFIEAQRASAGAVAAIRRCGPMASALWPRIMLTGRNGQVGRGDYEACFILYTLPYTFALNTNQ